VSSDRARSDALPAKSLQPLLFTANPEHVMVNAVGRRSIQKGMVKGKKFFTLTGTTFSATIAESSQSILQRQRRNLIGDELIATDVTISPICSRSPGQAGVVRCNLAATRYNRSSKYEFGFPYPLVGFI